MNEIIGFKALEMGQWVKVKGKLGEGGAFGAVEIEMQSSNDHAEVEGLIQSIDWQNNAIRMLNRQFTLPDRVVILDLDNNVISLKDLQPMTLAKLKGKYSVSAGFVTDNIKIKKAKGFTIEKLKGNIDKIDLEKKTLELVGFTVQANPRTTVELP